MSRVAVITANIGGIDGLKTFPKQSIECDYLSFIDKNLPFPLASLDNRMKAKYFKIQAHKFLDYDYFIWIDSSFRIKSPDFVAMMLDEVEGYDMVVTKHPDRNCIYDESEFIHALIKSGNLYLKSRYQNCKIDKQAAHYKSLGFPAQSGLYACGFFIRPNNERMNALFDKWWDACMQWSSFDQIAFRYLSEGYKIFPITFDQYLDNEYYKIIAHQKVI
jgi:hypothetical protein